MPVREGAHGHVHVHGDVHGHSKALAAIRTESVRFSTAASSAAAWATSSSARLWSSAELIRLLFCCEMHLCVRQQQRASAAR